MGKPTGFLEFERLSETHEPVEKRLKHFREFVRTLNDKDARTQGARCMECGIPFCHHACPVNNVIPDWNDLIYQGRWQDALAALHATNNFPDFTGRICPAPCEAACTLNINAEAVGIKSIEHFIADKAWENGWILPQPPQTPSGKKVAIVGSGPAGLAAAQQLARSGHAVTVFEKNARPGGLLAYGIPDFKLEKSVVDRRIAQMQAEGVTFRTRVLVGAANLPPGVCNDATETLTAEALHRDFDAIILAAGCETPRDLPLPGRELQGIHPALQYLIPQNKEIGGGDPNPIHARGKHVIVIGGGDTGSDCVGTSYRQGAASVTQFELMPEPPATENKALTWPYWPLKQRTSSSHQEGDTRREFSIGTQAFLGENGTVKAVKTVRLAWEGGKMTEIPGSEHTWPADLVFLAMGFTQPAETLLAAFGIDKDARGNARTAEGRTATRVDKVFAAGDVRRGQSLVVWAIREGRQCAREVDAFLA